MCYWHVHCYTHYAHIISHYACSTLPHPGCSCTGWGDGHHHPAPAIHHLPHASSYLLSCSARCNAERSHQALHPVQTRGLKDLKSRSLLLQMFWWKWFGARSHEKLSWQVEDRNWDCHRASSLRLKPTCSSLYYLRHEGEHKSVFS